MKTLYTLLLILICSVAAFSQQLPNNGFESWAGAGGAQLDPAGYYTPDSVEVVFGSPECVVQSTDMHGGQFSVKLVTITSAVPPAVGKIILGNSLEKGVPFTGKPTALRGWTKSNLGGEFASVSFGVKSAGAFIGENSQSFNGNYGWTQFVMPIVYLDSSLTPDSITMLVTLAGNADGEFLVDDFELLYGVVGIEEVEISHASLYPNPTRGESRLLVEGATSGFQYLLSDPTGRVVDTGKLFQGEARLILPTSGIYFVTVSNANGVTVNRKKLIAL